MATTKILLPVYVPTHEEQTFNSNIPSALKRMMFKRNLH